MELVAQARAYFPRGMEQPQGSLRFSIDALLLASFLGMPSFKTEVPLLVDLGTGCGVVALAMLLRFSCLQAVGVDLEPELLAAAQENSQRLGVSHRFRPVHADVRLLHAYASDFGSGEGLSSFVRSGHIVLCNPPYRLEGTGRLPQEPLRQRACFGTKKTLEDFCRAAEFVLAPGGICGFIIPWERYEDMVAALGTAGLSGRKVLPVASRQGKNPSLMLIEATRGGSGCLEQAPPLWLYEVGPGERKLTSQALEFCPFLSCNAKGGG